MGDGGLQMNIQELEVIGQYRLPVMVIVMNNHALGLIRDVHEKYYNSRYVGSVEGFSMPELKHLADAYHLDYYLADTEGSFGEIAARIPCERPCLVEVVLDGSTYVRPELLGNDGLDRQYPYTDK
jgi:acetolactate synthase-1/2/3 large subunit